MTVRSITVALALLAAACAGLARDDNAESLAFARKKLDVAKKAYKAEAAAFEKHVAAEFDKREEAARETANKKAVEQVKKDREAFKKWGELPAKLDRTKTIVEARARLADAYLEAARDYLRLKRDDDVAAVELEHGEFLLSSANLAGKRAFLSSLKPFNIRVENRWFASNGRVPFNDNQALSLNGEPAPHSLLLVPSSRTSSEVNYSLAGKYVRFLAEVGVPKFEDNAQDPASGLVFEVLGDGKSLWKSKPVAKMDEYQKTDVKIEKVKTLTLRVHCPDANAWARAVWFEPVAIEP